MSPQNFGKYVVIRSLGRGGMGEVYLAHHPDLARQVAIKTIFPHLAQDSAFEKRFRREAKLSANLQHPNIVQIHDFDMADGQPFMVLEYLEGGTLKDRLVQFHAQGQTMPLDQVAQLLDAIASALDYAHAQGAIHRDIKPANIMFRMGGEPVLTDFGIAKLMQDSVQISVSGDTIGTPAYMSPEQAAGKPIDAQSDLYSLGIVLYEMVTGRVPFQGETPTAVLMQHLLAEPPPPKQFNPNLPDAVQAVILKALAKDPAARFASSSELARAFKTALHSEIPIAQKESRPQARLNRPNAVTYSVIGCLSLLVCVIIVGELFIFLPRLFPSAMPSPSATSPMAAVAVTSIPSLPPATFIPTPSLPSACLGTGGRLLLFDEFDDPKSGWNNKGEEHYYENGLYHMSMTDTNKIMFVHIRVPDIGTYYRIETHARRIGGPSENEYGLVFAYQDADDQHMFRVTDSGTFRVSKLVQDEFKHLTPWTDMSFIRTGNLNALGLRIESTRITVCLNGQVLTTLTDPDLKTGEVGLIVGTSEQGVHVHFEDFAVWKLE